MVSLSLTAMTRLRNGLCLIRNLSETFYQRLDDLHTVERALYVENLTNMYRV